MNCVLNICVLCSNRKPSQSPSMAHTHTKKTKLLDYESEGDEGSNCNSRRAVLKSGEGHAARPGVGQQARLRVASQRPPPRGRGWERRVQLRAAWGGASSAGPRSQGGAARGLTSHERRMTSGAPAGPNPSSRSVLSWRSRVGEDADEDHIAR